MPLSFSPVNETYTSPKTYCIRTGEGSAFILHQHQTEVSGHPHALAILLSGLASPLSINRCARCEEIHLSRCIQSNFMPLPSGLQMSRLFRTSFSTGMAGIPQSLQRLAQGWTIRGSNHGGSKKFSFMHTLPDRPWTPTRLLYNAYRGSFLWVNHLSCGDDLTSTWRPGYATAELYLYSPSLPFKVTCTGQSSTSPYTYENVNNQLELYFKVYWSV